MFGNVLRRYLPGVTGQVVAAECHAGGCWQFVIIDPAAAARVTAAPYDVAAGWVAAKPVACNR